MMDGRVMFQSIASKAGQCEPVGLPQKTLRLDLSTDSAGRGEACVEPSVRVELGRAPAFSVSRKTDIIHIAKETAYEQSCAAIGERDVESSLATGELLRKS